MPYIAVAGIAHDVMEYMSHVPTQLMLAPRLGCQAHKAIATRVMLFRYRKGQLNLRQTSLVGHRLLSGFVQVSKLIGNGIRLKAKRIIWCLGLAQSRAAQIDVFLYR